MNVPQLVGKILADKLHKRRKTTHLVGTLNVETSDNLYAAIRWTFRKYGVGLKVYFDRY